MTLAADERYPLAPDSQPQEVPHGVVTRHTWTSRIFPGTVRDYWVYVPAQYEPDKPACVMVFQDGEGYANVEGRWRVPVVFDNLIHAQAMPVTIGIFINPGVLPPSREDLPGRTNRSFEYDALSDRYVRFLSEEILPEVGKEYKLSSDPNDRAISGCSSGGICSFTAAWFRPDVFRRVLSFVGSFANLRGGDAYPSIIRKTETKPIRAYLQAGKHDLDIYAGSWYLQNEAMAAALAHMGYDFKLEVGEEGHNDIHGSAILPEALRWLWRDWPQPIATPKPPDSREWVLEIVVPGAGWEKVDGECGEMNELLAAAPGSLYRLPGTSLVAAADAQGRWVWSYRVEPDGSLTNPEPFYRLETADETSATGAAGMAADEQGYLYVTTNLGLQVCDLEGRTAFIIANPPAGPATSIVFGGPERRTLFAVAGGKLFQRPVQPRGAVQ